MKTIVALFLFLVSFPCWAQTAHYRHDGPAILPDPIATPGAVRPDATKEQLCAKGFTTKAYRHTTEAMKREAYKQYGAIKKPGVCCEVDHLISLELGGADEAKNLWPEPYEPRPAAHEKDAVENYLHAQICAGKVSLSDAQKEIAKDWYKVFLLMPKARSGVKHRKPEVQQ